MKLYILILFLLVLWFTAALAQTPEPVYDHSRAKFYWNWFQGTKGPVEFWEWHCKREGQADETVFKYFEPTARSMNISNVVPGEGKYSCWLRAGNAAGVSAATPAVTFRTGFVPNAPTDLIVQPE